MTDSETDSNFIVVYGGLAVLSYVVYAKTGSVVYAAGAGVGAFYLVAYGALAGRQM